MTKVCAIVLAVTACGVELPVPTDLAHIDILRKGRLAKQGVPIDGWTCGARYAQAVTGVSEAVTAIARCREATLVGATGAAAFAATLVAAGVTADDRGSRAAVGVELGTALVSVVIGIVAGAVAGHHRVHAIEVYNQVVERVDDARRPRLPDE